MNKLAIATNNKNKLIEINNLFEINKISNVKVYSISDLNVFSDPEEDGATLEDNSLIKAKSLFDKTGYETIADDTGLFVDYLDGRPGVKSARYASEQANDSDNRKKLLEELINTVNRSAYFKTTICYINKSGKNFFEGICKGSISITKKGDNGFGYDPIFIPEGYNITFAEMDSSIKNKISHRSRALINFINWYKNK
jgi:XTP/dITP diphosphohydrolase